MKTAFFFKRFFRLSTSLKQDGTSLQAINKIKFTFLLFFLFCLLLCWNFKMSDLPGLHGDEAWMGIKANSYLHGEKVHLLGMNTYTGILQSSVSALSFKIFGTSLYGLRVAGPLFNFLGLLILICGVKKKNFGILFLVTVLQSSLLLISPRIAWEVNTFTLFFLSIAIVSILKIIESIERCNSSWTFVFLLVNILGTYNHVIFLCIPISAFIGLLAWSFLERDLGFIKLIILFLINLVNITLIFFLMKYGSGSFFGSTTYILIFAVALILLVQILIIHRISTIRVNIAFELKNYTLGIVVFGCLLNFLYYHGLALLEVFSNYKLIMHVYSYPFSWLVKTVFIICGITIICAIAYFLFQDVKNGGKAAIPAVAIISYLCVFSIFTTNNSMRYYLSIYVVFAIYLAYTINLQFRFGKIILTVLLATGLLNNTNLWKIYLNDNHNIAAMKVSVGTRLIENSGHFLPKAPLIRILQKNSIGSIYYDSERYFLEQPILFYKLIVPWKENKFKRAIIDIDYNPKDNTNGYFVLMN